MMTRLVSCGVIVTDGIRLLLGHATGSPRWDIPKGVAESGEAHVVAALRELHEETGLQAPEAAMVPLGLHDYMPGKDLALFLWQPDPLPDPAGLRCMAMVDRPRRRPVPELDRFGLFAFDAAGSMVGRNMARVLATVPALLP